MSKYRCPICGATHKEEPRACRMCGYRMGENIGELNVSATGTKPLIDNKGGMGRPMLFAAIGAVALAAAAVGLGFIATEDDDTVAEIRQQVPGIKAETPDGWGVVTSEEGLFTAEFPNANEAATRPLSTAAGGEIVGFEAESGEVVLFVGSAEVEPSELDTDARLEAYGLELAGTTADKLDADTKVDILGLRGYQFQEEREVEPGIYRTFNTILFLNGDRLYMVESSSKEDPAALTTDPPDEFTRVVNTMGITAAS